MLSFGLTGFETAGKALRDAAAVLEDEKIAREALHAATQPIADRMKDNMARSHGSGVHTADQVRVADAPSELGIARVHVGVRGGKGGRAFIGGFLERGTSKMAARPWARPAYEAEKAGMTGRFAAYLRERLSAIWKAAS